VASGVLAVASPADAGQPADPVLAWSGYGAQAITAGRAPASAMVLLGIEHVAMYDTAVALGLRAEPFVIRLRAQPGTSSAAAIATAAHHVVAARVPAQQAFLDATYANYLAGIPDGAGKRRGVDLGRRIAAAVLAWRAHDGLDNQVTYVQPPPGPGVWEPTAPAPPVDLVLTRVRPLSLRTASQFRPAGPLSLSSHRYAEEVHETGVRGRIDSSVRTAEQTAVAQFWAENTAVQWHRAVLRLASAKRLGLGAAARLLAMVFVAAGDAGIGCFAAKYHFLFWRPVQAIHQADPTWQPLLNVNHPEYPSGHACLTGAVAGALTAFFGTDRVVFTVDSTVTGTQESFGSFHAALDQVTEARIDSGLHLRHSMVDGGRLGYRTAWWVTAHDFRAS
jgi:hypothetical protein